MSSSWWMECAPEMFYDRARLEALRMLGSNVNIHVAGYAEPIKRKGRGKAYHEEEEDEKCA